MKADALYQLVKDRAHKLSGKMPDRIIMHPIDFDALKDEYDHALSIAVYSHEEHRFMGIKIIRSMDVKEGQIEVW